MRKFFLAALAVVAFASGARAQDSNVFDSSKSIAHSTGTVRIVQLSSQTFTLIETSTNQPAAYSSFNLVVGSDHEVVQTTSSASGICCGYEVDATTSIAPGAKGCIQAKKESGGNFYELEVYRWWQNLRLYCIGMSTTMSPIVRVLQTR